MSELVFVYGSLKRGLLHHDQISRAVFVGEAALVGHAMVLYEESYPALFADPGAEKVVLGELYSVDHDLLASLDRFEEVPVLYQRVLVTVMDGRQAFAYVIDPKLAAIYTRFEGPWVGR